MEWWEIWSHFWQALRWMGILVLAEVFLSGQLVWDSFESRFSFGSRNLPCVIFTLESAWNIDLLLLHSLALYFALSGALCSASLPEHHCLYFHCITTTLALMHCPFPRDAEGFSQVSQRSLGTGWTHSPTSLWFYPFQTLLSERHCSKKKKSKIVLTSGQKWDREEKPYTWFLHALLISGTDFISLCNNSLIHIANCYNFFGRKFSLLSLCTQ